MQIKMAGCAPADDPRMLHRVIPIRPIPAAVPVLRQTLLQGEAGPLQRLREALELDVGRALGLAPTSWLRELRLHDGEAFVGVAPGLGRSGVESAGIAFDTLRRLLPDTDIYVGTAPA
jgi:hypothetical protein